MEGNRAGELAAERIVEYLWSADILEFIIFSMLTLYGIPNCDTIKKTRNWLDAHHIAYTFHNYKTDGISAGRIRGWLKQQPLEKVLNRASTTWKELSDEEKAAAEDPEKAIAIMIESPSAIKRPLIEDAGGKIVALGFKAAEFEEKFL